MNLALRWCGHGSVHSVVRLRSVASISHLNVKWFHGACGHPRHLDSRQHLFGRHSTNNCPVTVQHKRCLSQEMYLRFMSPDVAPIGLAQKLIESAHSLTGLPWWLTIALTTFTLRTLVTFPISIYTNHIFAKVELLQPQIAALGHELRREVAAAVKIHDWDDGTARRHYKQNMKRLVRELYIEHNCHPLKGSLVVWFQIPMWVCVTFALRNMSGSLPVKGMELEVLCGDLANEGTLWFPNLLLPDTTYQLPLTMALSNLLIIEMHTLRKGDPSKLQKYLTNFMRGFCVVLVPIAATVPSCICWYWACSSVYGLAQNLLLKCPKVRRSFKIPRTPSESQTPFIDMWQVAKARVTRKPAQDKPAS